MKRLIAPMAIVVFLCMPLQAAEERRISGWRRLTSCFRCAGQAAVTAVHPEVQSVESETLPPPSIPEPRPTPEEIDELSCQLWPEVMDKRAGSVKRLLDAFPDGPEKAAAVNNARDEWGVPVLHNAVAMGSEEIVAALIAAGADVNLKEPFGQRSPLHGADDWQIVTRLLDARADINAASESGATPLCTFLSRHHKGNWAFGRRQTFWTFLTRGADVNKYGAYAPLMHVVIGELDECVKELIARGADVNALSWEGRSALSYAVVQSNEKLASLLRRHGAKDISEQAPLRAATKGAND